MIKEKKYRLVGRSWPRMDGGSGRGGDGLSRVHLHRLGPPLAPKPNERNRHATTCVSLGRTAAVSSIKRKTKPQVSRPMIDALHAAPIRLAPIAYSRTDFGRPLPRKP